MWCGLAVCPLTKSTLGGEVIKTGLRGLAGRLQSDKGMLFSFLNRAWSIVSTLGFIGIVVVWLSPELQGFYFTFISLLILLQVADMGFGIVLVQFASHEWANLEFDKDGAVVGDPTAKQRLGSLVGLALRWYSAAVIVFFIVLGAGGHWFFSASPDAAKVDWLAPWWLLSFFAALWLLVIPVTGLLEGCGQVARSQRNQLVANVLASITGWLVLLAGGELFSIAAMFAVRAAGGHILNTTAAWPILGLWRQSGGEHVIEWRARFWPQQWRIWLSWLAGFIVFQSFAPIAFQLDGAVAAGQIGVMVQAFHAVNQLASSRLTVLQPQMGIFASKGDLASVRQLVRSGVWQNTLAAAVLAAMAIALVYLLKLWIPEIGTRLGPTLNFAVFVITAIPLQLTNVETAAIRFQIKEPFLLAIWVCAGLTLSGSIFVTQYWSSQEMSLIFMGVTVLVLAPWVHKVYAAHMDLRS